MKFHHLCMADGLSNDIVLEVLQDSRGFIWIATQDGLNRYDGRSFRIYRHDPSDPGSISHNYIFRILEDSRGRLWVATRGGGLNLFDRNSETFRRIQHNPLDSGGLAHDEINALYEDRDGGLWVGTMRGLGRIQLDSDGDAPRFLNFHHNPELAGSLDSDLVTAITQDEGGRIWVGTDRGLNVSISDPRSGSPAGFTRLSGDPGDPDAFGGGPVSLLQRDENGRIWIWSEKGLYRSKTPVVNGRFPDWWKLPLPYPIKAGAKRIIAWQMARGREDRLWIATHGGLISCDPGGGAFKIHDLGDSGPSREPAGEVYTILVDRSGVVWAGTSQGLFKASPMLTRFHLLRHRPETPGSLGDNRVWSVLEDSRGRLWVGTKQGLDLAVDGMPAEGEPRFRHYRADPDPGRGLSNDHVITLCEGRDGSVWIGTNDGLNRAVFKDGDAFPDAFLRYRAASGESARLNDDVIISLACDREGQIWVGTGYGGLYRTRPDPDPRAPIVFTQVNLGVPPSRRYHDEQIDSILEAKDGSLWVGTWNLGPAYRAAGTEGFRFLSSRLGETRPLTIDSVICLTEDHQGRIWLGTHGGGLGRFDPAGGDFRRWLEADGLPDNVVKAIREDDLGHLWIGTNHGLAEFDPRSETFTTFTAEDGLQDQVFYRGASARGDDGRLYFGGPGGLNFFIPGSARASTPPPLLAFTGFRLAGADPGYGEGSPLSRPITETGRLVLSTRERPFTLEFAVLDFHNTTRNLYAYRLEGRDNEWTDLGDSGMVRFEGLPPGRYRLRVRGANAAGVWNLDGLALDILIRPPFWRTWWFALLAAFFVLGSGAGVVRLLRARRVSLLEDSPDLIPVFEKYHITPREREVILLVLQGRSYLEIQDSLFISLKTVKSHVYNVYQKLGVRNRLEMAHFLRRAAGRP